MSNLTTNPKIVHNSSVLTTVNVTAFTLSLQFNIYLKYLFYKKDILLTQSSLNFNSNRLDLCLHLYFRKKKLLRFKKLKNKKLKKKLKIDKIKKNIFFLILNNFTKTFQFNSLNLKLKILNKIKKSSKFRSYLRKKTKFLKSSLFERHAPLYDDFLNLTFLYYTAKISIDSFLLIFNEIFKYLVKQKHGRFIKFIKIVFNDILINRRNSNIKGAKFVISGKLRGKLRARSKTFFFGLSPISTQSKNVQYSKTHVYTMYGVFGFKLWIYQEVKFVLKKRRVSLSHIRKSLFSILKSKNRIKHLKLYTKKKRSNYLKDCIYDYKIDLYIRKKLNYLKKYKKAKQLKKKKISRKKKVNRKKKI